MYSSPAASRCMVVTPTAASAARTSRQPARRSPAAAMASSSPGVLGIGPAPRAGTGLRWGLGRRDCRLDFGMDLVRGSLTVDLAQQVALPVVVGERRGLLIVDLQPPLHRLGPVVLALVQGVGPPGALAWLVAGRRVVRLVPGAPAITADPAAGEPADELRLVHHQEQDGVER